MTGIIHVSRLRKNHAYASELDTDNALIGKGNPHGFFKMVVEPKMNSEGIYTYRYQRSSVGYNVSGEGYVITGNNEEEIDRKIKVLHKDKFEPCKHVLVPLNEQL